MGVEHYICMYIMCVTGVPIWRPEEGIRSPRTGVMYCCKLSCVFWELKLGFNFARATVAVNHQGISSASNHHFIPNAYNFIKYFSGHIGRLILDIFENSVHYNMGTPLLNFYVMNSLQFLILSVNLLEKGKDLDLGVYM